MYYYCLLVHSSSQKPFYLHSLSSHPFIMLPSSISLLTSSLVSRQEDRHRKSLIGPETKQEKFPHPSKELKIFDNVLGLAQIKEGDGSSTQVRQMTAHLIHPSYLKLR